MPRSFRNARARSRRLWPRMKRRRRALGVIFLRRHLRRGGCFVAARLAAASAAISRPSSSTWSRSSARRAVASPPLRKLTQYSPGKRLSVSPRARSSAATSSKRESESVSTIYSACASLFRQSTALIDSRGQGPTFPQGNKCLYCYAVDAEPHFGARKVSDKLTYGA